MSRGWAGEAEAGRDISEGREANEDPGQVRQDVGDAAVLGEAGEQTQDWPGGLSCSVSRLTGGGASSGDWPEARDHPG